MELMASSGSLSKTFKFDNYFSVFIFISRISKNKKPIICIFADDYFMAPDQVSCPVSQRVTNISECKLAAEKSGLNYYGDYFVIDRPPGCYYFRTQVYFNKNLEAKPSSVTWFGLGGICKGKGRSTYQIYINHDKYYRIIFVKCHLTNPFSLHIIKKLSRGYIRSTWMLERFYAQNYDTARENCINTKRKL